MAGVPKHVFERIAALENAVEKLYEHLDLEMPERSAGTVSDQVRGLAEEGKVGEAIQLHRKETGAGLAEAKDAIDSIQG